MNHLASLLERLNEAERAYKIADSSLDSSPLEVIVCRESLKQCRFNFSQAAMKLAIELLDSDEFMCEANRFINFEEIEV